MIQGRYFRIGEFDVWLGCSDQDKNVLRVEWLQDGLMITEFRIDGSTASVSESIGRLSLIAKTDKGQLRVDEYVVDGAIVNCKIKVTRSIFTALSLSGSCNYIKEYSFIKQVHVTSKI